jgi:hypothetical protein
VFFLFSDRDTGLNYLGYLFLVFLISYFSSHSKIYRSNTSIDYFKVIVPVAIKI